MPSHLEYDHSDPSSLIPGSTSCPRRPASRHRLRLKEDESSGSRSDIDPKAATMAAASAGVGEGRRSKAYLLKADG